MRHWLGILLLGLLLAGCSPYPVSGPRKQAQEALRQSMERDGSGVRPSSDSLARVAYDYFTRHGKKKERMHASYCLANAEFGLGNSVPAIMHFLEARRWGELCKDRRIQGFACQRLSEIFALHYDHTLALDYATQGTALLDGAGEHLAADYSRADIGRQYLALDRLPEAEALADSLLRSQPSDTGLLYYLYLLKADICFIKGEDTESAAYFERAGQLGYPLSMISWGNQALLQIRNGSFDEENVLEMAQSMVDTIVAYELRKEHCLRQMDYRSAYLALSEENERQYRVLTSLLSSSTGHTVNLFFENQYRLEQAHRRAQRLGYLLLALVLVLLALAAFRAAQRRKRQLAEDMERIEGLTRDLELLQMRKKGAESLVSSLVRDKILSIQALTRTYFSWSDTAVFLRDRNTGRAPREEVIAAFREEIRSLRRDADLIPCIEDALNHTYNQVIARLREQVLGRRFENLKVSERDMAFLSLLFAGFSNKSVAFILDWTDDSTRTRKKYFRKLFKSMGEAGQEFLSLLDGKPDQGGPLPQ